jgi:hypothetical protein
MYPRTVQIQNDKLKELITKKGELVEKGRAKSTEIEELEKQMEELNQKLIEKERAVNIDDLLEKEKVQTKIVEECIEKMKVIKQEIIDRMKAQIPPEMGNQYDELKKKKEALEEERNKVALKAQKMNDKIIPLGREMMKPFLTDQYEDFDTLYIEDGEVMATIFSHLNDFKTNFKKK